MRSELLKNISRIVVKLGTGVLTDARKQPDPAQLEQLVAQVAAQRRAGREIVLVTSGAVGSGMGALGFDKRPTSTAVLPADLLVILTTVDGMIQDFGKPEAKLLSVVNEIDAAIEGMAGGTTSATAVGGMSSKIQAAKIAVRSGVPLVIASGRKTDVL